MTTSRQIALMVDTSSSWGQQIIHGVCRFARERAPGWQLRMAWLGRHEPVGVAQLPPCDGVIARVTGESPAKEFARLRVPVVNVSATHWDAFDHCTWDEKSVARVAADHLISKGFRQLAYVGPFRVRRGDDLSTAFSAVAGNRLAGVCNPEVNTPERQQVSRLVDFLARLPRPVGILAWGPEEGARVLGICREQGWQVPHQVGVIAGDDDALLCDMSHPTLSAVDNAPHAVGYQAAELLATRLADQTLPVREHFVAPAGVHARASTDCFACGDPLVARAQSIIRERIHDPLTVSDLIVRMRVARRTLEYHFSRTLGHSPSEEIRRQKMVEAREKLATTTLSPKEIARLLGWDDESAFRRVFSRACGESPAVYRRRCGRGG